MKRTSLSVIGVSALLIAVPLGAAIAADMVTKDSAARGGASFTGFVRQLLGFCNHGLSADLVRHHGLRHD